MRGVAVRDLPAEFLARISPAGESARFMVSARNPSGPIWSVKSAAGNVLLSETSDHECEVVSFGPPVAATLKQARTAIVARDDTFTDAADAPDDFTPIRYGLERKRDDSKIHVILEGAEPNTVPGRTFRFSTLSARFSRMGAQ